MITIPAAEIKIDPSSYIDSAGRVFFWNERVFRGIHAPHTPFIKQILSDQVIKDLQARGMLVRTWIPEERAEGFDFVLEHEQIQFPSYCMEWPPSMLKDAALLTLHICRKLADHDFTLQDAYPWNVFFNGAQPVFIDFGSIMPARNDVLWAPYDQFCNFFLFPLYLYSVGLYDFARGRLFDYLNGITHTQFISAAPFALKWRYPFRYAKLAASYRLANTVDRFGWEDKARRMMQKTIARVDIKRGRRKFFESLIAEIEAIGLPRRSSFWSRYYKPEVCSYQDSELQAKETVVQRVLDTYHPRSIVDIGCNTGVFSKLASAQGCKAVAFDTDAASVEQLYLDAKNTRKDITPLTMDVLNPTPNFGWCGKQFPAAHERIKADMVFAFALIHHLAITGRQGFARALDALDAFSNGHVLLEWVSPEDPKVKKLIANSHRDHSWYSFDELKRCLEARYKDVVYYPLHTPTRQFILYAR